ncbi:GspH/FimT family pseudopilin [Thermus neutrinimicus]|uniref:GspH/FimT family pseudopilin n=1 Tax=Thermus neutrinimicus TaxID=2908149 RepID=UPI001FAA0163
MRWRHGFSLIELVILLAVLGVVLALSAGILNPDRQAVNQAAQSLAAQVTRARLEAIRQNAFAGLVFFTTGNGGYLVFVDRNGNRTYDTNEAIQTITFGQGDWGRVKLAQVSGGTSLVFDTRGIPTGFIQIETILSNRQGTYSKTVQISPQGRAAIQ